MNLIWKREKYTEAPQYTGHHPITYRYAVISKVRSRWELWIAGEYIGKHKTLKAAQAEANTLIGAAS